MKKTILSFVIMLVSVVAVAQTDSYTLAVKNMLTASGSDATYTMAIEQMLSVFKMKHPDVQKETWDELKKELLETSIDDLVEMLVPVYKKHLTEADLKAITAFYSTPVGKKYAEKIPDIMQESMQVGQQWGMQLGVKVNEILREKKE